MQIRSLSIRRYRALADFNWIPSAGVNCLIGPGDSGKSTVLAAISLLLAPYPIAAASEFDYLDRNVTDGFEIQACLAVAEDVLATERAIPPLRGWRDGQLVDLPEEGTEPVMVVRARGTADLEVVHEAIPLAGDPVPLSVGLRKKLLLARLAGDDRAARDLRVTQGSMLDRFLGRTDFRGALATAISAASRELVMPAGVEDNLQRLAELLDRAGLPHDLHLGLAATPGLSLPGLLTLLEGPDAATAIPLAFAGSGTRQLALLELSAALAGVEAVVVVDEPERGLEPYRQRIATRRITELAGAMGQAFLSTHAPAVLDALPEGAVWRMAPGTAPVQFAGDAISRLMRRDPASFFAPRPFICEGDTEVGFNSVFLPNRLGSPLERLGIHLVDGQGQRPSLDLLESFVAAGVPVVGFVDNEAEFVGRRARIVAATITFVWTGVRNIEEALAHGLATENLPALANWAAEAAGIEPRYFATQVRDGVPGATTNDIRALIVEHGEPPIRATLAEVMSRNGWFKRRRAGRVLATRLLEVGLPASMEAQLGPFVERLRIALG